MEGAKPSLPLTPPPFVITQFAYPNLPYDPDTALRAERLHQHLDALAATISAGPPRSALY